MKVKNWKRLERHPLSAEYPDLDGHAWDRFILNMREHGIVNKRKITVHEGKIIDGWQFYRACVETGTRPEFQSLPKGVTPDVFVETLNDHRRDEPQSVKEKRAEARRDRVIVARMEGKSTRQIAAEEGVSDTTIRNDLATISGAKGSHLNHDTSSENDTENVRNSQKSTPERVQGKDGKTYPAKTAKPLCDRCQRVGETEGCAKCQEVRKLAKAKPPKVSESDETLIQDAEGTVVPEQARQAFANAKIIESICRDIDGIITRVEAVCKDAGGRLIRFDSFKQQLKDAKGNLWANRPTHVCPYCHGKKDKCDCCKGEGWTAKHIYSQAPGVKDKK